MKKKWKMVSVLCMTMLICLVPVSAAIQSFPLKERIQIPSFPVEKPQTWTGHKKIDVITVSEALEIAAAHGVKENPCCPGISVRQSVVVVDQRMVRAYRINGPCGPILYIDKYSGEIVKTEYIMCMCFCVGEDGSLFVPGIY